MNQYYHNYPVDIANKVTEVVAEGQNDETDKDYQRDILDGFSDFGSQLRIFLREIDSGQNRQSQQNKNGFKNMTLGNFLWKIIFLKLLVIALFLNYFIYNKSLKSEYKTDEQKIDFVYKNLIGGNK